jgi:hypothetical protein
MMSGIVMMSDNVMMLDYVMIHKTGSLSVVLSITHEYGTTRRISQSRYCYLCSVIQCNITRASNRCAILVVSSVAYEFSTCLRCCYKTP